MSHAVSVDGVRFEKTLPDPLALPPVGYNPGHFRDPFVFRSDYDGLSHVPVTAELERPVIADRGGCLAHLVSEDLREWRTEEPFVIPGLYGSPECPDHFHPPGPGAFKPGSAGQDLKAKRECLS